MSNTFEQDKLTDFTVIRNSIFKDYTLSAKAKGVACQLLSLPPNWDYSVKGLVKTFNDGEASIRSALTELEERGYLRRERQRDQGKLGKNKYIITDMLKSEKPNVENPRVDNRAQLNTKELNTKELSSSLRSEDIYRDLPENLTEALKEFERMRKSIKKPLTDRARKMLLNKLDNLAGEDTELKVAILDQSIFNNWQDVYELKGDKTYGKRMGQIHDRTAPEDSRGLAESADNSGEGSGTGYRFPAEAYSL